MMSCAIFSVLEVEGMEPSEGVAFKFTLDSTHKILSLSLKNAREKHLWGLFPSWIRSMLSISQKLNIIKYNPAKMEGKSLRIRHLIGFTYLLKVL